MKEKKISKYISKYTSVLEIFYTSWVVLSAASKSVTVISFLLTIAALIGLINMFITVFFLKKIIFLNI